jgi:hypothetical protein
VGGGLLAGRLLAQPDAGLVSPAPGSGARVQHALGELVMRATGVSSRTEPLVLTSGELNEFLARHVEGRRLSFRPLLVQAGEDELQLAGRTSLGQLAGRSWIQPVLSWLPVAVRDLDLWVSVQGRLALRQGELEFAVQRATLGRQAVPPSWLWQALDFDPREQLRWRLPRVVERIEVRPGQLIIHTRHHGR